MNFYSRFCFRPILNFSYFRCADLCRSFASLHSVLCSQQKLLRAPRDLLLFLIRTVRFGSVYQCLQLCKSIVKLVLCLRLCDSSASSLGVQRSSSSKAGTRVLPISLELGSVV